ncbi:MAG: enoyl-CoA hydratase/isomerase family protein [Pseudomonadota bacterium]
MTLALVHSGGHVEADVRERVGVLTLRRPQALNALSLGMIRDLTTALLAWRDDPSIAGVFVQGALEEGKSVAFCAGGDIRFFHQAALAGDPRLEDFFTEEYWLNHLIHRYPKPYIAWMDGVVMGGGMGISQGARLRVVTERTKMAMPETNIGLFPDVGGGWFLARCPGRVGEFLALTGQVLGAGDAVEWGLADGHLPSTERESFLAALVEASREGADALLRQGRALLHTDAQRVVALHREAIDRCFAEADVPSIYRALEAEGSEWALSVLAALQKRSPLMQAVTLEQVRRARGMSLAEDLRMERDLVRHCFHLRPGAASETVEGIRALAVDKDHAPRWNPATIEGVTAQTVQEFFRSPWPVHAHPLKDLA